VKAGDGRRAMFRKWRLTVNKLRFVFHGRSVGRTAGGKGKRTMAKSRGRRQAELVVVELYFMKENQQKKPKNKKL
jgi:hypothetical protein